MQDKPSARELLEAVAAFLSEEVAAELSGRKRFHALVAANVARIVAREIELAPALLREERRRLTELLGEGGPPAAGDAEAVARLNEELCRRIRDGWADTQPTRRRVFDHLRFVVGAKLDIDNPRFPR
ncbi:MAG: hypothetical protein D6760_13035 [Deltaproteobacteria bacterium]|nr:MAG: hypothetical protein D6760_13035 [Deltaproteobacteria bacterium]